MVGEKHGPAISNTRAPCSIAYSGIAQVITHRISSKVVLDSHNVVFRDDANSENC